MPPRTKQQARDRKWGRYLKIAGDAGTIAMALRDKPTPLDWLGVGLRAMGFGSIGDLVAHPGAEPKSTTILQGGDEFALEHVEHVTTFAPVVSGVARAVFHHAHAKVADLKGSPDGDARRTRVGGGWNREPQRRSERNVSNLHLSLQE